VRMSNPRIEINLEAIRENAGCVVARGRRLGCRVVGVTKGCCGFPPIARAMLDGGVSMIGDSRLENIQRMRRAGIKAEFMLLRLPMPKEVEAVVEAVDVSLNSELEVVRALGKCAVRRGKVHRVILMIDLGDLREGVLPADAAGMVERIMETPGVKLEGIGTNLACYGGVVPTRENMQLLLALKEEIERACAIKVAVVSGGNSANMRMLWEGVLPAGINQLRIGEGILLGNETVERVKLPGLRQDTFCLKAEIIELKEKPSVPIGRVGQNALGEVPQFQDRGVRLRAILGMGRQDVITASLIPCAPGVDIIGASSDHLIVDVTDSAAPWRVGMEMAFKMEYGALMTAMASPYVKKSIGPGKGRVVSINERRKGTGCRSYR